MRAIYTTKAITLMEVIPTSATCFMRKLGMQGEIPLKRLKVRDLLPGLAMARVPRRPFDATTMD
jgi:hypothetical protein